MRSVSLVSKARGVVLSQALAFGVQLAATVILARLLSPNDFGLVTMVHDQPATHELRTEWVYRSHRAAGKDQRFDNQQSILDRRGRGFSSDRWVCGHRVATGAILWERGHSVRGRGHVHTIFLSSISVIHLALLRRAMHYSAVSANVLVGRAVSVVVAMLLGGPVGGFGRW